MMARSDSASDGEEGGCPRSENAGNSCSGFDDQESSPSTRANGGEGAGSVVGGSTSRRSRRKQSDPRRLDSDILNVVRMDEHNVDISADTMDDDDDEVDVNVDTDGYRELNQIDDEVFIRGKLKSEAIALDCSSNTTRESSPRSHSPLINIGLNGKVDMDNEHGQDQFDDVPCQPEDLSLGKKKRGHNRVVLAIPSVIRPRPQSLTVQRDYVNDARNFDDSGNCSQKRQQEPAAAHSFDTLSSKLQNQSNLMTLERDYRLKFTPEYDAEDRKSSSYINDHDFLHGQPRFAVAHNQKLTLDPDCPSSSPDLHCDSKNGKTSPSTSTSSSSSTSPSSKTSKKQQRSYKNLSRSRRIVANARERNRVHTISAAFEGLRRAVPSYSHNQKLSKLAILRIACSYILALAKLADLDYSSDDQQQAMSFEDCVDLCTHTLQAEGRSKRRKGAME